MQKRKFPPKKIINSAGIFVMFSAVILIAASKKKITGSYHHPFWMQLAGWIVVLLMSGMGSITIYNTLMQLL